jgi:hypothetical protein
MSEDKKTIQEALAEVQRKVNEERVSKAKAEWEAIEEGTALVPYNAVNRNDWRTVSNVPQAPKTSSVASSSIPKVGGVLKTFGRFAGPIAAGASIGSTASDILGAASRTETGRNVGRWVRDNVPGAPAAAEAMKKAGEAIGVREPSPSWMPQTPSTTTTTAASSTATPPKRPSDTELNKLSRDKGLADSGSKYAAGKPHSVTDLKVTEPGQQGKVQSRTIEKGWADPGRWENEAKSKTGSMQQIRGGKVMDTATTQLGRPSASAEKSTQSFLDKELGRKPTETSTPAMNPQQRWEASKKETGVSDTTAKAQTTAVQSQPSGQKSTSDFLKSQGVGVSTEDGKKKKMSEETNPLIAAFLKLQTENSRNMFEAAKKAKKDYDGDGKIESEKDEVWGSRFAAAKKAGKMEEANIDPVVTGSSSVTKSKTGYVDPSTPKVPYSELPKPGNAAGDVLSKAKNALDKTGVKEEAEQVDEISRELARKTVMNRGLKSHEAEMNYDSEGQEKHLKKHFAGLERYGNKFGKKAAAGVSRSIEKKLGFAEETEEVTFSQAEIDHINSFFLEASVAPNRPEVAAEARSDSVKDGVSQNDVTGTSTEGGKKKIKEETEKKKYKKLSYDEFIKGRIENPTAEQHKEIGQRLKKAGVPGSGWHFRKAKEMQKNVKEETLEEGRPRKNPVASEEESPVKNIAAQVRTARSVTNDGGKSYHIPLKHPVSGKVHHVPQKAVDDFNKSYAAARKADEKEAVETAFKNKHMSE